MLCWGLCYDMGNMNRHLAFLSLSIGILGLGFFGWGCNKSTDNSQRTTSNSYGRVGEWRNRQPSSTANGATTTGVTTPIEPQALAYLLLTKDAKVTVSRDGASMQGVSEMELLAGDTVEVTTGEARLLYQDTGMSVLEQGSKVTLIPDGEPKAGGLGLQVMLEAGKIWTRLERLLGSDETMSVNANDVVATVRGTGFGVQNMNGDVDVTVADHRVQVSARTRLNTGKEISQSVLLAAGSGLHINPASINKMTDLRTQLLKNIRNLTPIEKQQPGYLFGLHRFTSEDLKKPANPLRWSAPLVLSPAISERLSPSVTQRWQANILWFNAHQLELQQAEKVFMANTTRQIRFMPPMRSINLLEVTPTTTPSAAGPRG